MRFAFYDDTHEILISDLVNYFYEKEWLNFDLAYNLLQETDIVSLFNKMCINWETNTVAEQMYYRENYTECIKKFTREKDQKELLRNLRMTAHSIIVPLKVYLLVEIRGYFYHEFDTLWYATSLNTDNCDETFREEYKKKLREKADTYTKIFSRCNKETHYYFNKSIYNKAKEEFWELSKLDEIEQMLEKEKFISFSKFLSVAEEINGWEKHLKILWIDAKKSDIKIVKEDWEWGVTWLDFSFFSMLFTDTLPIIYLHRNVDDAPIWLLYNLYCSWDTSFCKDILKSWWRWIILNPFRSFTDFCEREGRERKQVVEGLKEKYREVFYWNKTLKDIKLNQLFKDIEKCCDIWTNKLTIKFHDNIPTEMKHEFTLTKEQERDFEKYREYALMEWEWTWHIWYTWWKWKKYSAEWRKMYYLKEKKKKDWEEKDWK